jgi:hypothetical protein
MNIHYILRLTDELTEEYNANEYISLYLSIRLTDKYKSIFLGYGPRALTTCPYITPILAASPDGLTEEYRHIRSSVNQGIYWFFI